MVTLPQGGALHFASDKEFWQYIHHCQEAILYHEARHILSLPLFERRRHLTEVGNHRGAKGRARLEQKIREEFERTHKVKGQLSITDL